MVTAHDRLAAKVARLDGLVRGLATGPQMGYSSLENGSIEEYDAAGQLSAIIGKQPDGTHGAVVVSGPNPPRPSAAIVSGGPGLLNFGWDGNFADESTGATDISIPAPLDWARTEAHASQVSGFQAETTATLLDSLESPRGGSRTAMLDPGVWYVVLVSRALSGKRSVQSVEVRVEVLEPVGSDIDVDALRGEFQAADAEMNAAIVRNKQAQDTLAGTVGTLRDTTLPGLNQDLALAKERLVSAETAINTAIPSQINTAKQAAIDAAAADATAKKGQAEAAAALDAKAKADKALADAKLDATSKANAAEAAAKTAAALDAKSQAEAAEARAAATAAADAKAKADAAQAAALAAAKTYADAQASGAGGDALAAAKLDATAKSDAAKQAAINAAALDATAKKEQAEATAAADAKAKADKALADAKLDATSKANAAEAAAKTAAALDAKAKADAAQAAAAADAKDKADKALADAKADAAAQVQVVVNTIMGQTYYGTAVPSASVPGGTIKPGSTYRRKNTSGNVIGEYEYTITSGTGSWVQRKMTSESFTAVDVGVLTAGTAAILEVVAQKIAAATAAFQTADIGNLFVTGDSKLNTITSQRIASTVGEFLKISTDQLIAGTASFGEAVARKFASETGAFMKLYASQVYIGQGGNLLIDPQFLDPELNLYRRTVSSGTWELVPGTATSAAAMRTVTATTNTTFFFQRNGSPTASNTKEMVPVTPGQVYDFSVDITTSAVAICRWNLFMLKSDGAVAYTGMTQFSGTGRRELKYSYTVPDGVVAVFPALACLTSGVTWTVHGNATFREKVTPSLIVDGLMNGQRIVGASIETNAAASQGIKLTDAGLFGYNDSGAETLRFDGINSIITGAVYRTAATGERVQLDATGMTAWNASNAQIFKIAGGSVSMTGALTASGMTQPQTIPVLPAMAISMTMGPEVPVYISGSPTSSKVPGIQWVTPAAGMLVPPQVYSASGRGLTLSGGVNGSNRSGGLDLYDGAASLYGSNGVSITSQIGAITLSAPGSGIDVLSRLRFPNPQGQVVWASATSSAGVQSGVVWGPGNLSMSTNLNAAGVISFPGNDTLLLSEAGIYSISALINTGSPGTWNTYATLKVGTSDTGEPISAAGKAAGPWEFVLPSVTRWFNAGTTLRFRYGQSSGAAQSWSTVVNVVKHLG